MLEILSNRIKVSCPEEAKELKEVADAAAVDADADDVSAAATAAVAAAVAAAVVVVRSRFVNGRGTRKRPARERQMQVGCDTCCISWRGSQPGQKVGARRLLTCGRVNHSLGP